MAKLLPFNNRENLDPEEIRRRLEEAAQKQKEAADFANAKEAESGHLRTWPTQAEKEALADRTAEVVPLTPRPSASAETETGLDPVQHERLQADPTAWIHDAISDPKLAAYQKMLGMTEALEKRNKEKGKENLPKAA